MTDLDKTLTYWINRYEAAKTRHNKAERKHHTHKKTMTACSMGFAYTHIIRTIKLMREP